MSVQPQPETSNAIFTDVRSKTVSKAEDLLSAFTNITWEDQNGNKIKSPNSGWIVTPTGQQPEEDIGLSEPTDLAITLTIAPAR